MIDEKKRILVVDDCENIRQSLKNFFKDYKVEVFVSVNGLDGIQKTAEHRPHLIILDLMMPNLDGIKMLQVIKVLEGLNTIPVIVISANTEKKNVLSAIESGADRVISKPLQRDTLIKSINDLMGAEFLGRPINHVFLSEIEKIEMQKQLVNFFMDQFPIKQQGILDSIMNRDKDTLKSIVHEFKGAGGTIGYPRITEMSYEIEKKLDYSETDWTYISLKCEQLLKFIKDVNKRK